jgi:hypothetical protein
VLAMLVPSASAPAGHSDESMVDAVHSVLATRDAAGHFRFG